ncbi:p092 [Rhizobium phage 16-3]|uniref:p092 n=1 Tax=Rhizobium phage 16-3 TaxID=10704 RepID=UPI00017BA655|nr:p092 [Rhizobium phage 16-3]ABF71340.1 p092 [Rhizobium phage 16-3]
MLDDDFEAKVEAELARTAKKPNIAWLKVSEVAPPQRTLLMVTGSSGYRTYRQFLELAYVDEEYRPSRGGPLRWQTVQNDALSDFGYEPTHWAYPITLPEDS